MRFLPLGIALTSFIGLIGVIALPADFGQTHVSGAGKSETINGARSQLDLTKLDKVVPLFRPFVTKEGDPSFKSLGEFFVKRIGRYTIAICPMPSIL